jgi:hypothetical protein
MKLIALKRSDKPGKKFYAELKFEDGKTKRIYFGKAGATDFTQDSALSRIERRHLYIKRHEKREDWTDPLTPGFWSRWILWEKPTISAAVQALLYRFPYLKQE